MPSIPVHLVESRYRPYAWALVSCGFLLVTLQFGWQTGQAIVTRNSPPTISDIVDGSERNSTAWGPMPYIIVLGRTSAVTFKWLWLNDADRKEYGDTFNKFSEDLPSFTHWTIGNALVLNMTSYHPNFNINDVKYMIHANMEPQFEFCWQTEGWGEVYLAPANTPLNAFPPTSVNTEQYFSHEAVVARGSYAWVDLKKEVTPGSGIYWGLPGDSPPVRERCSLSSGAKSATNEGGCLHLTVSSPEVVRMQPVSIVSQFAVAASRAGGSVALVSSLFALLFIRRHQLSKPEIAQNELTLRGHADSTIVESYEPLNHA